MGGILPSGGSTINEVRLTPSTLANSDPRSINSTLYAPVPEDPAAANNGPSDVPSTLASSCALFFSSASASPSLSVAFPASAAGRSSGVMVAFVQTPCRSGWPSGVRGIVQFVALARGAAPGAWPGRGAANITASTPKDAKTGEHIRYCPPSYFRWVLLLLIVRRPGTR